MLYHISELFNSANYDIPGIAMMSSIAFRAMMAAIFALIITITFGKHIIAFIRSRQIGEDIRDLGLEGQLQKKGTPTMGGIMILLAILLPTLFLADLQNHYILLMLITTLWLGAVGFADDYIKVFRKNKDGLSGKLKIAGQVGLGCIVGLVMWYSPEVVVRESSVEPTEIYVRQSNGALRSETQMRIVMGENDIKSTKTTIPFIKENELDYKALVGGNDALTLILYVLIATLVVTAVSNGANLTDGLDGLAAGVSIPVVATLGILAYLSGNILYADYLNIIYIPSSGELGIFAAAFTGALIGFLWYNSYPAQVFMGDTGSLAIGGLIAVLALCIRKELMLPLLCAIFFLESFSVIIQVAYFKYTKRKYGEGRRVFLMSPLHHHYQKKGIFENKIVVRFTIASVLIAAMAVATLKIR